MGNSDVPSQVRIRTDPDDDLDDRYRAIQRAKEQLDAGNQTAAVVDACRHVRYDTKAKSDALSYLAGRVDAETLAGVVERLDTPTVPVSVAIDANPDRLSVDVDVGKGPGGGSHRHDATDH
jgi:hypothetical protein